jgi:hypothetical protein
MGPGTIGGRAAARATPHTLQYCERDGWSQPLPRELDGGQTLVVAFAAPSFGSRPEPLAELAQAFPRSCLIGCSTAGEIHGTRLADDSLSVAVMPFLRTRLRRVSSAIAQSNSFATGRALAERLAAPDLRAVFVLAEGLDVNGSELVRGCNEVLPEQVVVTGGLAADGDRFGRTWVLDGGRPASGVAAAVGFYGDAVRIGHGSKGGWDTFGPERTITRARGNVLYELDGKPALELYKQYLGERSDGLPATAMLFPLALRARDDEQKLIVRTVLAVDDATQSMTFAGDVPEGQLARLMRANHDRIVEGAAEASRLGAAGCTAPGLAIAISCVGRRLVLGERVEEEIESAWSALPPGSQQIGYYSYGEISPFLRGFCDLHNQTMTVTTIAEP